MTLPTRDDALAAMKLANDYFMAVNPDPGGNEWFRAVYFEGDMALYAVTGDTRYLDYALSWAEQNQWSLSDGPTTRNADNQCAGQTYIDLYRLDPDPERIAAVKANIDAIIRDNKRDDWWWIDALQMAMPVYARLGALENDPTYFEAMYELYADTKVRRGLFNPDDGLWYRDENYLPARRLTPNGKPIYWSRGNGWVFAAHARILEELPPDEAHRDEYVATFQQMAEALRTRQRDDGFWNVSLGDPDDFGGPESSGTAFFTYGMAWGIRHGYLDPAVYTPVVARAWYALTHTALHPDGKLGWVQRIGGAPAAHQPVTYDDTSDFAVGAFLLAGSEVAQLAPP